MDYGDEFNDDEEKRYKKEAYGDGEEEAEEEGEDEQEESSVSEIVPLAKEFSRRANRGQKMNALMTKALEEEEDEDDDFWRTYFGGSVLKKKKEGEEAEQEENALDDDVSFNSKEEGVQQDSFDSDFGKSEDGEEGEAE